MEEDEDEDPVFTVTGVPFPCHQPSLQVHVITPDIQQTTT